MCDSVLLKKSFVYYLFSCFINRDIKWVVMLSPELNDIYDIPYISIIVIIIIRLRKRDIITHSRCHFLRVSGQKHVYNILYLFTLLCNLLN